MPWVQFKKDFDFKHTQHHLTAYKASKEPVLVTSKAAAAAIEAGVAVEVDREKVDRKKNAARKNNKG